MIEILVCVCVWTLYKYTDSSEGTINPGQAGSDISRVPSSDR